MTNIKALYFPVFNSSHTHSPATMLVVKYFAVDYGDTYYVARETKVKMADVTCKFLTRLIETNTIGPNEMT